MISSPSSLAVITPARDEAANLRRLGACLLLQTVRPDEWIIVDDGSRDETAAVVAEFAREAGWIRGITSSEDQGGALEDGRSGGRDVIAFNTGLAALEHEPRFICKLDADVSLQPEYFERLLARFRDDPALGIASGLCYEEERGAWVPKHMTEGHVRGAARVWRWECFQQVRPLHVRLGWDAVDELEANVRGWGTFSFPDIPILHHRKHGARDGATKAWIGEGDTSYFLGYRFSYLVIRALHHARREPRALAMIWGFIAAAGQRRPRYAGEAAREHLRRRQRWRELPHRRRESAGG